VASKRTCSVAGLVKPFAGQQRRGVPLGPTGRCSWAGDTANLDPYLRAIPAMQEEAAALVAVLVFAGEAAPTAAP